MGISAWYGCVHVWLGGYMWVCVWLGYSQLKVHGSAAWALFCRLSLNRTALCYRPTVGSSNLPGSGISPPPTQMAACWVRASCSPPEPEDIWDLSCHCLGFYRWDYTCTSACISLPVYVYVYSDIVLLFNLCDSETCCIGTDRKAFQANSSC